MKKNRKIIISVMFLLLSIILGLPIKVKAAETIDVTGLATGSGTAHDCSRYAISKYDEQYHWRQCSVCGAIQGGKTPHNTVINTPNGYNCNLATGYKTIRCNGCGYYKTLPKQEHSSSSNFVTNSDRNEHFKYCSVCTLGLDYEKCRDAQGHLLGCGNYGGVCATCGLYKGKDQHNNVDCHEVIQSAPTTNGYITKSILKCSCGKIYGECTLTTTTLATTTEQVTILIDAVVSTNFSLPDNITVNFGTCWRYTEKPGCSVSVTDYEKIGNTVHAKGSIVLTPEVLDSGVHEIHLGIWNLQHPEEFHDGWIHAKGFIQPDRVAPAVSGTPTISYSNYVNGYATSATLTSRFYELYDNMCYVRILDSDKTTVLDNWKAASQNGDYFTSSSNIFIEENSGRTIYVQAKDNTGNTSDFIPVNISKIDTKQPVPSAASSTATAWSKTKSYTAAATEGGSGEVKIAFNDVNRYLAAQKNGNKYTKDYIFTGDVYGAIVVSIYYKDNVNNDITRQLIIHNLDNTAPTITGVNKNMNSAHTSMKIIVSAHDINSSLGKSGSGVAKYSISNSNTSPGSWQNSNELNISKNGTYYVYAMDTAGNVSAPLRVDVTGFTAPVIYKDVAESVNGTVLHEWTAVEKQIGLVVNGSDKGTPSGANNPYKGYQYSTCTSATVAAGGVTVYRIFTVPKITVSGTVSWEDNKNKYSTRPDKITITIQQDGKDFMSMEGLTEKNSNSFSFKNLQKYSFQDGHEYVYTARQEGVVSKHSPEDKYETTKNGAFDFLNLLKNTDKDEIEIPSDSKGFCIEGNIYWQDNNDSLGIRPGTVKITLLQDGNEYKEVTTASVDGQHYSFEKLPKYRYEGTTPIAYNYSVKETIDAWYSQDGKLISAYDIVEDNPSSHDFTNKFHKPDGEFIIVSEYKNTLFINTNQDKPVEVTLKQLYMTIDSSFNVEYGEYNKNEYKIMVDKNTIKLENIPSGKYEVTVSGDLSLDAILRDSSSDSYFRVDGSCIEIVPANSDVNGRITLSLSKTDASDSYNYKESFANYFRN